MHFFVYPMPYKAFLSCSQRIVAKYFLQSKSVHHYMGAHRNFSKGGGGANPKNAPHMEKEVAKSPHGKKGPP